MLQKPLVVSVLAAALTLRSAAAAPVLFPRQENTSLSACPGYTASDVQTTDTGVTATLTLAGEACNVYGDDIVDLILAVEYQTGE